jgi:hypothetical protein
MGGVVVAAIGPVWMGKKRQYLRPSLSEMKEIKTTPTIFPELVVRLS